MTEATAPINADDDPRRADAVTLSGGPASPMLTVRLYPSNELANATGALTVQVAILSAARGRFALNYEGETLTGEAMRIAHGDGRGVASVYSARGIFARCDYQMSSPRAGGTCALSNGAQYELRIGS